LEEAGPYEILGENYARFFYHCITSSNIYHLLSLKCFGLISLGITGPNVLLATLWPFQSSLCQSSILQHSLLFYSQDEGRNLSRSWGTSYKTTYDIIPGNSNFKEELCMRM